MSVYRSTEKGSHRRVKWKDEDWREWARCVEFDLDTLCTNGAYRTDRRLDTIRDDFEALLAFLGIERSSTPPTPTYRHKKRP